MKAAAIIAEFNPFHNGHAEIIRAAREMTGADYIIILMSGNYVQRGTPAIIDRDTRCRAALACGADLVISQPARYCTSSAENYALQSVRLLNALGVVQWLVFGSECGEITKLRKAAESLSDEDSLFQEKLRDYLKSGISFPKARAMAVPEHGEILSSPNNVLAVEYIKALISTGSSIEPVTIRRLGADYNDETSIEKYSSASAIRNVMESIYQRPVLTYGADHIGKSYTSGELIPADPAGQMYFRCIYDLSGSIPEAPLHMQMQSACTEGIVTEEDFSVILAEKVWQAESPDFFMQFSDVTPDLARSVYNNRSACFSFGHFAETLKNKAITRTHINRALLHIALGICRGGDNPLYAHVIGCRETSTNLLGEISGQALVPVITRPAKQMENLEPDVRELLKEEIRVSDLYNTVRSVKNKRTVQSTLSSRFIRL